MGSLAKGFFRKVCGNPAETSRKFGANVNFLASGKAAKSFRKFGGN